VLSNNTKTATTEPNPQSASWTLMKREDYDWIDLYCPQCGSERVFMLVVRLHPVRELAEAELTQAIAVGMVIEDGNYFLQKTISCLDCDATTKFTEPIESPWAPRPN
jgi:hypothetical protein